MGKEAVRSSGMKVIEQYYDDNLKELKPRDLGLISREKEKELKRERINGGMVINGNNHMEDFILARYSIISLNEKNKFYFKNRRIIRR